MQMLNIVRFIFNAFVNLEPVQRSEDGCDMRRFRSFNHSMCKTVLNLLEASTAKRMNNPYFGDFRTFQRSIKIHGYCCRSSARV